MKRLLQSVALALAAFLAVQPALAAITCGRMVCADGHSRMNCCLPSSGASMQGMSNDDSMASMDAANASARQAPSQFVPVEPDCLSAPCCTASARSTTLPAASVKSRFDGVVPIARLGGVVVAAVPIRMAATPDDAAFSPGDRHALFQVFRI